MVALRWLHQKLAAATVPPDRQFYQRQIEATDRLVAMRELRPTEVPEGEAGAGYGLTEATDRSE